MHAIVSLIREHDYVNVKSLVRGAHGNHLTRILIAYFITDALLHTGAGLAPEERALIHDPV